MATKKAILDASALVAIVSKERGHEVLTTIIMAGSAATTPTGLAEALTVCRRNGHKQSREDLSNGLRDIGLKIESIIEEDAVEIAFLLAKSDALRNRKVGSLSLGDATCLAVAFRLDATAVMSDNTWEILGIPGLKIMPFR
ncbi:MAG: PIN domain-containing protein [Ilumatobacteraceae bacterium]